jgi:hypothetical protein
VQGGLLWVWPDEAPTAAEEAAAASELLEMHCMHDSFQTANLLDLCSCCCMLLHVMRLVSLILLLMQPSHWYSIALLNPHNVATASEVIYIWLQDRQLSAAKVQPVNAAASMQCPQQQAAFM